ncbi:MAG: aspartate carbamoyltransferase catalytic subunit [Acidimicrobiia bacterium]|nr:aspartate carbamoyltransferase catalytic subunit [Acidimicrobiia bacterium]
MKHLLSISDLERSSIEAILDGAEHMASVLGREIPKVPALRGKTVANLFYEDSTRTRLSFETAAKRLSADTMTFTVTSSSVKKGESLLDTVKTIEAMGIDALVVRHSAAGAPHRIAGWVDASVVNAGDGRHEHPTQALLDAFTLRRHRGPSLDGARIAVVGDVRNSRVARSGIECWTRLGAQVLVVGPPTLMPENLDGWPVTVHSNLDDVLGEIDVAYILRVQQERLGPAILPSLREYYTRYGLTAQRAEQMKPDALVMHPGPMIRGPEIATEVADGPRSLIREQVSNGIAVRMAVLWELIGSGGIL